jgi:hypothetical protein
MCTKRLAILPAACLSVLLASGERAPAQAPVVSSDTMMTFDTDPNWDGFRNRLIPPRKNVVKQSFGYRKSKHAGGKDAGEIGGTVQRSTHRATYGKSIEPLTLKDRLSASGTFAVTRADSSSGVLFGWFNEDSRGWRTPNSLGFRIDGNGAKYWLFFEYGTRNWLTGGGGCFEGDRYQTTKTPPFRADGTIHRWTLTYDARKADQSGIVTFHVDDRTYSVEVPPEHKADGATFNRFGLWNVQAAGESLDVYYDNLIVNGRRESFDTDPAWVADGNELEFEDRVIRPFHDFGYSRTRHAGGNEGEIGGILFRDERPAYYGARIEPVVTLDMELEASGRLAFLQAGSDSGIHFGWFNAESKRTKEKSDLEEPQTNLLGITVEGPSRVGHYFRATYATSMGQGGAPLADPITGIERPLIKPDGKPHHWSLHYSPSAANGRGQITVTLDDFKHTLDLREGERKQGATFDRFGFFNLQAGGHHVEFYLDDITCRAKLHADR